MASLSVRMDDATKIGLSKFCKEIGVSVSSIINTFAEKVVSEQKLPFELRTKKKFDPFYSEENMAFLREVIEDDRKGVRMVSTTLAELEEKYKACL